MTPSSKLAARITERMQRARLLPTADSTQAHQQQLSTAAQMMAVAMPTVSVRVQRSNVTAAPQSTLTDILNNNPGPVSFSAFCDMAGIHLSALSVLGSHLEPPAPASHQYSALPAIDLNQDGAMKKLKRRQSSVAVFARKAETSTAVAHASLSVLAGASDVTLSKAATTASGAATLSAGRIMMRCCLLPEKRALEWAVSSVSSSVSSLNTALKHDIESLEKQAPFLFVAVWRATKILTARYLEGEASGVDESTAVEAENLVRQVLTLKQLHDAKSKTAWLKWRKSLAENVLKSLTAEKESLRVACESVQSQTVAAEALLTEMADARNRMSDTLRRSEELGRVDAEWQQCAQVSAQRQKELRAAEEQHTLQRTSLNAMVDLRDRLRSQYEQMRTAAEENELKCRQAISTEAENKRLGRTDTTLASALNDANNAARRYDAAVAKYGWVPVAADGEAASPVTVLRYSTHGGVDFEATVDFESAQVAVSSTTASHTSESVSRLARTVSPAYRTIIAALEQRCRNIREQATAAQSTGSSKPAVVEAFLSAHHALRTVDAVAECVESTPAAMAAWGSVTPRLASTTATTASSGGEFGAALCFDVVDLTRRVKLRLSSDLGAWSQQHRAGGQLFEMTVAASGTSTDGELDSFRTRCRDAIAARFKSGMSLGEMKAFVGHTVVAIRESYVACVVDATSL
jgi:hypothetical protein